MIYNKVFTTEVEKRYKALQEIKAKYGLSILAKSPNLEVYKKAYEVAETIYESIFDGADEHMNKLWEQELEERKELCMKYIERANRITGLKRLEFGSDLTDPQGFFDGHIFFTDAKIGEDYGGDEGWLLYLYINGQECGTISPYDVKHIVPRRTPP